MSSKNRSQTDDPQETVDYLLKKHGQHEAYAIALQGVFEAQDNGDNCSLSVWREVKYLLKRDIGSSAK